MSKVFYVDVAKCSGCYNCQFACKEEHVDNDWTPYAKPQPTIGQFWLKVQENVQGTMPKIRIHYIPQLCNHCDNAACMTACEAGAITRRDDGLVLIEPEKCTGCGKCVEACPYDAVFFNEKLNIAQKCTGCAHLLDNGKMPRCVDVCPTEALLFGEEEELAEKIRGADVMKPETGLNPKVYYRNIPGQFIGGTLYDPDEEEIIEDARCHLSAGAKVWDTLSDDFGDFWFKDLPVGKYDLMITAKGYEPKYFNGLDTAESINLGDIPMKKV